MSWKFSKQFYQVLLAKSQFIFPEISLIRWQQKDIFLLFAFEDSMDFLQYQMQLYQDLNATSWLSIELSFQSLPLSRASLLVSKFLPNDFALLDHLLCPGLDLFLLLEDQQSLQYSQLLCSFPFRVWKLQPSTQTFNLDLQNLLLLTHQHPIQENRTCVSQVKNSRNRLMLLWVHRYPYHILHYSFDRSIG